MKKPSNASLSPFLIGFRTFPLCNITVLDEVDSTNNWLKDNGTSHGQIVLARRQTGGKGTKGRSFFSPDGSGLYLSILLTEGLGESHLKLLTCAAAAATAEAIEIICNVDAKIKWINDIYVNNKKAGGILTESKLSSDGKLESVIVGIGINLFEPEGGFGELSDIATAVLSKGRSSTFNWLAAEIVNRLRFYYEAIEKKEFLQVCRAKSCVLGKRITVTTSYGSFEAEARDIDDEGRLTVTTSDDQKMTLYSADVTIKV